MVLNESLRMLTCLSTSFSLWFQPRLNELCMSFGESEIESSQILTSLNRILMSLNQP